jgi:hypothetical protein
MGVVILGGLLTSTALRAAPATAAARRASWSPHHAGVRRLVSSGFGVLALARTLGLGHFAFGVRDDLAARFDSILAVEGRLELDS